MFFSTSVLSPLQYLIASAARGPRLLGVLQTVLHSTTFRLTVMKRRAHLLSLCHLNSVASLSLCVSVSPFFQHLLSLSPSFYFFTVLGFVQSTTVGFPAAAVEREHQQYFSCSWCMYFRALAVHLVRAMRRTSSKRDKCIRAPSGLDCHSNKKTTVVSYVGSINVSIFLHIYVTH